MKLLKVAILIALMSLLAHAQERSTADATYAIKGPVRTFKVEIATFVSKDGDYVEEPRVVQMEASFNQDGNRTDLRLYNEKGMLSRRIVMKFEGRRMTEAINYDGEGKMIQKTSTNQQSWGPQLIAKSDYTYDASGNIKSIREEYPNAGPLVMNFYPVYSNKPNTLSVNNPPLSAFIWNLIDANFFKDGFEEVFLFSKNVVSGTKRDLNGTINDYSFNIEVDIYNNITRISNYPKLYSSSYLTDPVFYDMHLYYLLR